jgi:hypothetical protein
VLQQVRGAAGQVRQILLEAGVDEWVEAVVAAARASVARSPLRFRNAYVVSIEDVVGFVTSRRRSLSSATVLAGVAALLQPGERASLADASSPANNHEVATDAD